MIQFYLQSKYKSLDPFQCDIVNFTVLTGLNGSGKTQILTAIKAGNIKILKDQNELLGQIRYVPLQGLVPNGNDARMPGAEEIDVDAALNFLSQNLPIYLERIKAESNISFYDALNNDRIGTATRQGYIKNINAVNAVAKQSKKILEN